MSEFGMLLLMVLSVALIGYTAIKVTEEVAKQVKEKWNEHKE